MRFEDYFSFEAIVRDLVKWRVAGKDVDGTLPPRKMWSRAGVKERKGVDPAVVRKQAILRTVRQARGGALGSFEWGRKLMELVAGVREAVFSGTVAFEPPKMFKIAKGREDGKMTYREVASFERLADRVILSRMTAYVRDRLEGVLTDRSSSRSAAGASGSPPPAPSWWSWGSSSWPVSTIRPITPPTSTCRAP